MAELAYNYVELPTPKRSSFDLSFDRKMSFDLDGSLYPILIQEMIPGDTFHLRVSDIVRFMPLVSPVYHRLDCKLWSFFVPNRLVWDSWEDFITRKNTDLSIPYITMKAAHALEVTFPALSRLLDYCDVPINQSGAYDSGSGKGNEVPLCALPLRALSLIWNEYFRDEFKQSEVTIYKGNSGLCTVPEISTFLLRKIGWEKDYFTTAQTSPQMGASVTLPGTDKFSVKSDGKLCLKEFATGEPISSDSPIYVKGGASSDGHLYGTIDGIFPKLSYSSGLDVDHAEGTIEELRQANHLQRWLEKFQLGGQRYNETILSNFGVTVPDYRVQRPEYIGGSVHPIEIGRVLQTSEGQSSPLGSYAGQAEGTNKSDMMSYTATEHGYWITLMTVVPRSGYQQGIPRQMIKRDIFDYYWPDFATLGDQEIFNDEIFADKTTTEGGFGNGIFGYVPRYADYKQNTDKTNGQFRDTLSFWHMNRIFDSLPALNGDFITSDPTTRIFAVEQESGDRLFGEFYMDLKAVRPMPTSVLPDLE